MWQRYAMFQYSDVNECNSYYLSNFIANEIQGKQWQASKALNSKA